jgi:predicted DNA binding CopG/RHH family protein
MEIMPETYNALKALTKNPEETNISESAVIKLIRFLFFYLNVKTDITLKSATSLLQYIKQTINYARKGNETL